MRHETTTFCVLLAAALMVALIAPLTGCNSDQIDALKAQARSAESVVATTGEQVDVAKATKAEIDAEIATMDPGADRDRLEAYSDKLADAIARGETILADAQTALATFNARLAESDDALDVVNAGAQAVAPSLPVPYGAILTGVVGLATTTLSLFRAKKNKDAAHNIAWSVDGVMADFLEANPEAKREIRMQQGPYAGKIVDEAQGKTKGLPI